MSVMRRILCLVLLVVAGVLVPGTSRADGKVFSSVNVAEPVRIPDQRAILSWSEGIERLVIETRFAGRGSNFAWVVPLPARPVVEPVSPGLFTTLVEVMQPTVIHTPTLFWLPGMIVTAILAAGLSGRVRWRELALVATILLLAGGMLLPSLSSSKGGGTRGGGWVEILDHQNAGVFESTTITGRDPAAVRQWLTQHGYQMPPEVEPVLRDYLAEGWVFVASKVHRPLETQDPGTLHPLQFTFPTKNPVYPLRLTGVGNGALEVDLFVFGDERAHADHFDVIESRSIAPDTGGRRLLPHPSVLSLAHEGLTAVAGEASWATRLRGRLTHETLKNDAILHWSGHEYRHEIVYSDQGAWLTDLNWTINGFNVLVIALAVHTRLRPGGSPFRRKTLLIGTAVLLVATAAIRLSLPVVPTRNISKARLALTFRDQNTVKVAAQLAAVDAIETPEPVTVESVRKTIAQELSKARPAPRIREEDSPWNYSLRGQSNGVDLILHDAIGGIREIIPIQPGTTPQRQRVP